MTHIWPTRVTVRHLDNLVLLREPAETLAATMLRLDRLSISTEAEDVEVHPEG
jgi:hypothetical protein